MKNIMGNAPLIPVFAADQAAHHRGYQPEISRKKSIAITLGAHLAVVAIILALPKQTIVANIPDVTKIFWVKADDKPEPLPPQPPMEQETPPADPTVFTPPAPPIEKVPVEPDNGILDGNGSLGGFAGIPGDLDGLLTPRDKLMPKPKPLPILVEPQLDSRYAERFLPPYPSRLLREDLEGKVRVRVLVGTNGRVQDIQLLSADHPDFWKATQRHARRKWRFRPATQDGTAIEQWMTLTVQFRIAEERRG